ncbi:hypothetical protein ACHAPT_005214 [Fusarium lateritium]
MSEATPTGKANAWTEEAKPDLNVLQNEFLLRIIMQLKPDGKGINWSEIQMPGRTVKSLQNQWTSVNKKIEVLKEQKQNGDAAGTPVKKATRKYLVSSHRNWVKANHSLCQARKRRAKKHESEEDDDASFVSPKKPRSRKRSTTDTPERTAKAIKEEAAELEDFPIKEEPEFDVVSEHGQD